MGRLTVLKATRRGAISGLLTLLDYFRANAWQPSAAGQGLIFTLHHVRPTSKKTFDPNAHLSVTPEFLEEAIRQMLALGYVPAALADVPDLLTANTSQRFFVMTLDDAYRNNAEHAAPIFRQFGVPYTIFASKGLCEHTRSMWWETAATLVESAGAVCFDFGGGSQSHPSSTLNQKLELFDRFAAFVSSGDEDNAVERIDAAALSHGIDPLAIVRDLVMGPDEVSALALDPLCRFGAHTVTHCDLSRVSDARLRDEICQSMSAVGLWTGRMPETFAYPYGFARVSGAREQIAVRDAGLALAVTTRPGVLKRECIAALSALPRISLNGHYQKARYVRALASGSAFRFIR